MVVIICRMLKKITAKKMLQNSIDSALPCRASNRVPFFAWLMCASGPCKVSAVLDGGARWNMPNYWAVRGATIDRIGKGRSLNQLQKALVTSYVDRRYRGSNKCRFYDVLTDFEPTQIKERRAWLGVNKFLEGCYTTTKLPLRTILSDEFAILTTIKFMEFYV
jgi:hypothetical protein